MGLCGLSVPARSDCLAPLFRLVTLLLLLASAQALISPDLCSLIQDCMLFRSHGEGKLLEDVGFLGPESTYAGWSGGMSLRCKPGHLVTLDNCLPEHFKEPVETHLSPLSMPCPLLLRVLSVGCSSLPCSASQPLSFCTPHCSPSTAAVPAHPQECSSGGTMG